MYPAVLDRSISPSGQQTPDRKIGFVTVIFVVSRDTTVGRLPDWQRQKVRTDIYCPGCSHQNQPDARFCSQCGTRLHATASETPADAQTSPTERRLLSVMFCDLVGSTALAARLDPEDLRDVLNAWQSAIAAIVTGAGGFVAKYMGDGVMVYFGWPRADEADAERAVAAALAVRDDIMRARPEFESLAGQRLNLRVGIATGLAVVGDLIGAGAAQEQAVIGEIPILASRLQTLAQPGAIVIDAATRRKIGGLFDCHDLGSVSLKGLARPVPAWEVRGQREGQSRFEALQDDRLAPDRP